MLFSLEWVCLIVVTGDTNTSRVESELEVRGQLIAKLKVHILFFGLKVLKEPHLAVAEVNVALDSPRKAMAHEAEIHETRAHGHFLRPEGVTIVTRISLVLLIE